MRRNDEDDNARLRRAVEAARMRGAIPAIDHGPQRIGDILPHVVDEIRRAVGIFGQWRGDTMGRPFAIDAETLSVILGWIRRGYSFDDAATEAGVHPETFRRARVRSTEMQAAAVEARATWQRRRDALLAGSGAGIA